jgi:hypothetical protein
LGRYVLAESVKDMDVGNGIDDCRLSCMRGCSEEDSEQEEDTTEVVTESKTSGGDEKK